MNKVIARSFFLSSLILLPGMANSTDSLDYEKNSLEVASSVESCPSPLDIKNKNGIFTASANEHPAGWIGVILDSEYDYAVKFEKAYFFVLRRKIEKHLGFLDKCTYTTFSGKNLELRLSLGRLENKFMSVEGTSWNPSLDISSSLVLECTDQFRDACRFSLSPNYSTSTL